MSTNMFDDEIGDDQNDPELHLLHYCGSGIIPLQDPGYSETFGVFVATYAAPPHPASRAVVTLGSYDGDGGPPNMWWHFDPDTAVELAEQLLHNAAVARDFNAQVN